MVIDIKKDSDFSIHNIPFGIFSKDGSSPRVGVAIGEQILDLVELAKHQVFDFDTTVFNSPYLNDFIALGKPITTKLRSDIQSWLQNDHHILEQFKLDLFVNQSDVKMHMPIKVGDYTDFYSSIEHATNVGSLFRDPENALLPNWRHLPVGYHGRASSIIVSGTDVKRPSGQFKPTESDVPFYGPSKRLDFELEMAFVIGKSSQLGDQVSMSEANDYIFGMVLFNDWSARDIQKWEYVPLGPFLGKSFASSISPWVVTMEALQPFRIAGPSQQPEVLPYLQRKTDSNYDIHLEVSIAAEGFEKEIICRSNYKYMYWDMCQQLTHHTVNGCNLQVGDLMASGTISGKDEQSFGSLLEMSQGGRKALKLDNGMSRTFLEDGDQITMTAHANKDNIRVGFGEVKSTISPANPV